MSLRRLHLVTSRLLGRMGERRASVGVEAAIVLPVYVMFTVFMFQMALLFFWQEVLDSALSSATRQIQTGQAQSQVSDAGGFVKTIMCPALNGLLDCSQIMVTTQVVANYYANATYTLPRDKDGNIDKTKGTYCNGGRSQLMLVRAIYIAPISLWPMLPSSSGFTPIVSSAAFQNEPFDVVGGNPC